MGGFRVVIPHQVTALNPPTKTNYNNMANPNAINPDFPGLASSGVDITQAAGGAKVIEFGRDRLGIYVGSGAPTISANKGSLYLRTDGSSTSTRLYINNGTTTWVAITTAS